VVAINRVAKVVKAPAILLTALVVVGDGQGHVGVGLGRPASSRGDPQVGGACKKDLLLVPLKDTTIPCEITGHFGAARVYSTGRAGDRGHRGRRGASVLEAAGVQDILTKTLGTNNPHTAEGDDGRVPAAEAVAVTYAARRGPWKAMRRRYRWQRSLSDVVRTSSGSPPNQEANVHALGLRHIRQVVEHATRRPSAA